MYIKAMKLIVGLGNPGEKYVNTRHNLGFMVADRFLKDVTPSKQSWSEEKKLKSLLATIDFPLNPNTAEKVILVLPQIFMNNSGEAVARITSFYKILPEDVWILNDDLDLPLGALKIRFGGAAAGHHGVESIIAHLGTDKFWRFRLGIGTTKQYIDRSAEAGDGKMHDVAKIYVHDAADFVLGNFTSHEQTEVKKLLKNGVEALEIALKKGLKTAQNRFNTK